MTSPSFTDLLDELERWLEGGGQPDPEALSRVNAVCDALAHSGGDRSRLEDVLTGFSQLYSDHEHQAHKGGIAGLRSHVRADIEAVRKARPKRPKP